MVRSSTAAGLERGLPRGDVSLWEHYPITVVSIDYVKSDRRRDNFLRAAPDLVIVDEAHTAPTRAGAARASSSATTWCAAAAAQPDRHLLLLTATPHSGVEDAFRSLLGLLDPRFAALGPAAAERSASAMTWPATLCSAAAPMCATGSSEDTPFPARSRRR